MITLLALALVLIYAPLFFYMGEFVYRYVPFTVRTLWEKGELAPLPEHPIWEGGSLEEGRLVKTWEGSTRYRLPGTWREPRQSKKFLEVWSLLTGGVLAVFLPVVVASAGASGPTKEREAKPLVPRLSSPLSNGSIANHLLVEAGGPMPLALVLALPIVALITVVAGYATVFYVAFFLFYAVALSIFFGSLGLRLGLTSPSTKKAQGRIGGVYVAMALGWPFLGSLLLALISFSRIGRGPSEETSTLLMGPSPLGMPLMVAVSEDVGRFHSDRATFMLVVAWVAAFVYGLAGLLIRAMATDKLRELVQRVKD